MELGCGAARRPPGRDGGEVNPSSTQPTARCPSSPSPPTSSPGARPPSRTISFEDKASIAGGRSARREDPGALPSLLQRGEPHHPARSEHREAAATDWGFKCLPL